jgi:hypothetical protein
MHLTKELRQLILTYAFDKNYNPINKLITIVNDRLKLLCLIESYDMIIIDMKIKTINDLQTCINYYNLQLRLLHLTSNFYFYNFDFNNQPFKVLAFTLDYNDNTILSNDAMVKLIDILSNVVEYNIINNFF